MAKKKPTFFDNYNATQVLALSFMVYETQGFIRSGEGYTDYKDADNPVEVKDNKTHVLGMMEQNVMPSEKYTDLASATIDKFNGKFMLKKLTGGLTKFEQGVSSAFSEELTNFHVAVIASIPHMNEIDKKRQAVSDKIEALRFDSEFFGETRKRYNISVEVIDVKFIQSSGVYMITSVYNNRDIIKFWWRDQPDISDIIDGKAINLRGTVNKHEKSKYSNAKETMLNRVKISEKKVDK